MLLLACGDDGGGGGGTGGSTGGSESTGTPTVVDDDGTTSAATTEVADSSDDGGSSDTGEEPPSKICPDGLPRTAFDDTATEAAYDDPAPDFTVETLRGTYDFGEEWTGCDNYVLVVYNAGAGGGTEFWGSSVEALLDDSDDNTVYLFAVRSDDAQVRETFVNDVGARIEGGLMERGQEVYDAWTWRFRYVLDDAADIPALAMAIDTNPGERHVTVDRMQRVREGHNVSIFNGTWVPQLAQTRYWAKYYNGQYLLDQQLAEEEARGDVLVHRIADGQEIRAQGWADGHPVTEPHEWEFPDAETMAQYDTLAIDLHVDCPGAGHPYVATCGEWDTVGSIFLCTDEECTPAERRRVVKWITPYSAPGRWLIDITPELVHLQQGGTLRFVTAGGDNNAGPYTYRYTADLRFGHAEDEFAPIGMEELVPRGSYGWNDGFHDQWNQFTINPPKGTQRVELYARISGHGAADGNNCAEFCTFTHNFAVGGVDYAYTYEMEQSVNRCAELVSEGVTPNQGGTWFFDRSSWCPGYTIEEWREDITDAVDLTGGETVIDYTSTFGMGGPAGGSMDMRVEVVYYG